jgi:hypothetical protein
VYDVQVHPSTNDLVLATHGRGFFVLDDAAALQQLDAARTAGAMFFPVREATLWSGWPSIETGDGNGLPANNFAAPSTPSGAVLTFYQHAKAKQRPWIEILDASGNAVRTLRGSYLTDEGKKWFVTNDRGINRIVWDGNEDGPVRWNGTSLQNAGPLTGAEALPGTYVARLHIDGVVKEQTFRLVDDPQVSWTPEERAARHAFLATIYRWYDGIDRALNAIDSRMKGASPAQRARLVALRDELTSNPLHDEDSIAKPNHIRERLLEVAGQLGGALQPPFEQHVAARSALVDDLTVAYRDIDAVLGTGFVTLGTAPSP